MNVNIDYKQKSLKYKVKYLKLKKLFEELNIQTGGILPIWYPQFENEMREIFYNVSNRYPNVVLTGSGAIVYLLKELGMDDELNNIEPGDLDLIYKSRLAEPNPEIIGNYKIKPGQEYESSVTFVSTEDNKYIKSFDVSKTNPNIKSFKFNGIEIIDLNRLKSDYKPSFETPEERIEKDRYKMSVIDKIIQHIGREGRLNEFGLDDNMFVKKDMRHKTSSLFGNDDDDDIDNDDTDKFMAGNFSSRFTEFDSPKKPKSSGLFGYDSDDEK
jgi:hypothetical protein